MSFLDYEEIRKWTTGNTNTPLESLLQTRAMPPWPADPTVGHFKNNLHLTEPELKLLLEWIAAGLPRGEGQAQSAKRWVEGWNIGEPDAVFELPEQTVGEDEFSATREVIVETNFEDDRWVIAAEARPGDAELVTRIEAGALGGFRPGNSFVVHPQGTGRLLKRGESIRVTLQYRNQFGLESNDRSKLGVVFAEVDAPVPGPIVEERMAAPDFTIPAGAPQVEVRTRFEFPADGRIVALTPTMQLRGKDVRYEAVTPDGTRHALLSIPVWDPSWQFRYELKTPLAVPRGTIVEAVAHFDNSEENLMNPDPTIDVKARRGAEEFFEGWIAYMLDAE